MIPELEEKLRTKSAQHLYLIEAVLYVGVGALLSAAALAAVIEAAVILWKGVVSGAASNYGLLILQQLLLVLMLVEILHTVRISIRSQTFSMEPFLIVGLIASIRRVLVLTMEAAKIAEQGEPQTAAAFQNAMIELGLLGFLILVFVTSIHVLRRSVGKEDLLRE